MKKPVVHFEIGCDNLKETTAFYKDIFDWTIVNEEHSAAIQHDGEKGIPGHITALGHDPRKYINIYIETDTIDDDLERIQTKGGKLLVGPIELPDGRFFAWFQDIADNTVGLITPSPNN